MTSEEILPKGQLDEELVKLILKEKDSSGFDREELFHQQLKLLLKRGANPKMTIKGNTLPDILLDNSSGSLYARKVIFAAARILVDAGAGFNDDDRRLEFMYEHINHIDYHRQFQVSHPEFYRQAASKLFWRVNVGQTEIFSLLLDNGVDPNSVHANCQTLISVAIYNQKMELINLLLQAGARLDVKDQNGITPFDIARAAYMKDPSDTVRVKIYDLIRRETATQCPPQAEVHADDKTGELTRVTQNLMTCQRITEVFNFARGVYSRTDEHIDKPGVSTNIRLFQELQGTGLLAEANEVFKRLTGKEPPVEYRYDAKRNSGDQPLPG